MLDSDLQHPPELIPKLLEEMEAGQDIVYTIRRDSDKWAGPSGSRRSCSTGS